MFKLTNYKAVLTQIRKWYQYHYSFFYKKILFFFSSSASVTYFRLCYTFLIWWILGFSEPQCTYCMDESETDTILRQFDNIGATLEYSFNRDPEYLTPEHTTMMRQHFENFSDLDVNTLSSYERTDARRGFYNAFHYAGATINRINQNPNPSYADVEIRNTLTALRNAMVRYRFPEYF